MNNILLYLNCQKYNFIYVDDLILFYCFCYKRHAYSCDDSNKVCHPLKFPNVDIINEHFHLFPQLETMQTKYNLLEVNPPYKIYYYDDTIKYRDAMHISKSYMYACKYGHLLYCVMFDEFMYRKALKSTFDKSDNYKSLMDKAHGATGVALNFPRTLFCSLESGNTDIAEYMLLSLACFTFGSFVDDLSTYMNRILSSSHNNISSFRWVYEKLSKVFPIIKETIENKYCSYLGSAIGKGSIEVVSYYRNINEEAFNQYFMSDVYEMYEGIYLSFRDYDEYYSKAIISLIMDASDTQKRRDDLFRIAYLCKKSNLMSYIMTQYARHDNFKCSEINDSRYISVYVDALIENDIDFIDVFDNLILRGVKCPLNEAFMRNVMYDLCRMSQDADQDVDINTLQRAFNKYMSTVPLGWASLKDAIVSMFKRLCYDEYYDKFVWFYKTNKLHISKSDLLDIVYSRMSNCLLTFKILKYIMSLSIYDVNDLDRIQAIFHPLTLKFFAMRISEVYRYDMSSYGINMSMFEDLKKLVIDKVVSIYSKYLKDSSISNISKHELRIIVESIRHNKKVEMRDMNAIFNEVESTKESNPSLVLINFVIPLIYENHDFDFDNQIFTGRRHSHNQFCVKKCTLKYIDKITKTYTEQFVYIDFPKFTRNSELM